ncbi:alpha/beta hydrolase-fold protein [Paucibacter sediminis]|uniref:Alpha/beta hydrolase-fold protein n=1 Tax=Paucibacter sediminis TaxID=3019553 RepID=A0AA95SRB6_9BURK|nr:alpha/beta hydrolase-fold protein [Paucibacter sp. S2-9]WIT13026.1 alpha/beta hydrolase-fold protein [Paucibacter sp. S2-9]
MLKRLFPTLICLTLAACCGGAPAAEPPSYQLERTEVHALRAIALQRDYQLFVSLPAGYGLDPARRYPVLFTADADYGFPLLRSIAKRVGDHGRGLQEFILVGLSYAQGDSPTISRNRDYTPAPRPGQAMVYGGAEPYRRYLAEQVLPYVAEHFRADMGQLSFLGHSYGALLGCHILLSSPSLFQRYILSSPSLWYEDHLMFKRARARLAAQGELPAEVLLLAGALERPQGSRTEGDDIAGDIRRFETLLKAARPPGLRVQSQVIADEDHLSVAPSAYTRGLRWALAPGRQR